MMMEMMMMMMMSSDCVYSQQYLGKLTLCKDLLDRLRSNVIKPIKQEKFQKLVKILKGENIDIADTRKLELHQNHESTSFGWTELLVLFSVRLVRMINTRDMGKKLCCLAFEPRLSQGQVHD